MKYTYIILLAFLYVFSSCDDMNDLHDIYLEDGERIYLGKVDSAYVFPGQNRVKLRYWPSDPRATKMVVYWAGRSDSLLVDINPEEVGDSSDVIIENLEEYDHFFEIITMNDQLKNRSIPYTLSGKVFGDKFGQTLTQRTIREVVLDSTSGIWSIDWLGKVEKGIGTDILYTDKTGEEVKQYASMDEFTTVLQDSISDLQYRTLFLPAADALDTFYTEYVAYPIP